MRHAGRALALVLPTGLGGVVGVAAIALHRSTSSAVIAMTTTLVAMWALRWWSEHAVLAFGAGWIGVVLVALAGRGEGDYVISSDARGWLLIGFGFVVLVTAILWARPIRVRHDSGPLGGPT